MKIAHIASQAAFTPPTRYGSAQYIVYELARTQLKWGNDVTIFGVKNPSIPLLVRMKFDSLFKSPRKSKMYGRMPQVLHVGYSLVKILLEKFDVIHNHVVTPGIFAGTLFNNLGIPYLTSLHNDPPFSTRAGSAYRHLLQSSYCVATIKKSGNKIK